MHPLEQKIRKAKEEGRIAIIPFLTAGFPNREDFWKYLDELDMGGADVIEIGVPFSDPVADGPVVEKASRKSLEQGITLKEILATLKERNKKDDASSSRKISAGIVLMGYLNPFLQYGLEKLAKDAEEAGVGGIIVPDLPFEESHLVSKILQKHHIALIPLVGLNTSPERMMLYSRDAQGYVYVISVMGITGERNALSEGVGKMIEQARKIFKVPVALGFGLKHPDQLNELKGGQKPDAAVFGSALLTHLEKNEKPEDFLKPWREKIS